MAAASCASLVASDAPSVAIGPKRPCDAPMDVFAVLRHDYKQV